MKRNTKFIVALVAGLLTYGGLFALKSAARHRHCQAKHGSETRFFSPNHFENRGKDKEKCQRFHHPETSDTQIERK